MRCVSNASRPVVASGALILACVAALHGQCETVPFISPHQFFLGDSFGSAISAAGDELVVGSWKSGVTTFFRDSGPSALDLMDETWVEQDHLSHDPSLWTDFFGASVSLHGDVLVVGAPGDFFTPAFARVYRRDAGALAGDPADDSWIEQADLEEDPAWSGSSLQSFGDVVLADTSQVFVAAPGVDLVYVFGHDDAGTPMDPADDTWLLVQVIEGPPDPGFAPFGGSLARLGDHLLVGQAGSGLFGGTGAVHDYRRDDAGTPGHPADDLWLPHGTLVVQGSSEPTHFGSHLVAYGQRVLVSAAHSVFEFGLLDGGTPQDPADDAWAQLAELLTEPEHVAASALSLQGDIAMVAGAWVSGFSYEPRVWLFRRETGGTWHEITQVAPPAFASPYFGSAVALAGDFAFVGDIGESFALTQDAGSLVGFVVPYALVKQPWSYVDAVIVGSSDDPELFGAGALAAGEPYVVTLTKAPPGLPGLLVVGGSMLNLPLLGSLLVPSPDRLIGFVPNASGALSLEADWPAGLPSGFTLHLQAWIEDSAPPLGWATSNALSLVAP